MIFGGRYLKAWEGPGVESCDKVLKQREIISDLISSIGGRREDIIGMEVLGRIARN